MKFKPSFYAADLLKALICRPCDNGHWSRTFVGCLAGAIGAYRFGFLALMLAMTAPGLMAATRFVNLNNATPTSPYSSWTTAATDIQTAIDVAGDGDLILVTNGVYASGARSVHGMSNRVAITKAVTVQSVNGSEATTIAGSREPGAIHGPSAVRCVYLANGAVLTGFTLTNGATHDWQDISAFYATNQSGGGVWCESAAALVMNCVLTGNSAYSGGGGAYRGTLSNCTLTGNSAFHGGGAYNATLNNCTLTGNTASVYGGGAHSSVLNNCTLTANSAINAGGGAYNAMLKNCTLTGNSAKGVFGSGGGTALGTLNNCIVYYNSATIASGANYAGGIFSHCCTTPLPLSGAGNFGAEPLLASFSRLTATSPCRGAGSAAHSNGVDIDGEPWANPPSIGSDELWSGSVTGILSAAIATAYTNVAVGFELNLQAMIGGRVSASRWDFGDGTVVSNRPYASHRWAAVGDYVVELRAYNESYPEGVTANVMVRVVQEVHYVSLTSAAPAIPYGSWATAATNIQDAVDAAVVPGALVLVSNGVYNVGGRAVYEISNRVAVTRPLRLQSVNGPAVTAIAGNHDPVRTFGGTAVRCVYLTSGAVLAGFTLTNGATQRNGDYIFEDQGGGGVWCETVGALVTNCVMTVNRAIYGGGAYNGTFINCTFTGNWALYAGGVYRSTLNNCNLKDNTAAGIYAFGGGAGESTLNNCAVAGNIIDGTYAKGGGVYGSILNNCTLTGNSAFGTLASGGGAYGGILNNCIVYYNTASGSANYDGSATLSYCCTTPLPGNGTGNFDNDPLFLDTSGWGNLRLQSNSACVNAGNNGNAFGVIDLDGRSRIVGGTVDIGAYEFQPAISGVFIGWLKQYGLATDGSADSADGDEDGLNNWQEWRCLTEPNNALSALRLLAPSVIGNKVTLTWKSASGVGYTVERSTNLGAMLPTFAPLAIGIPGEPGTTTYTDTNAVGSAPLFYRVGVQP